MSLDLAKLAQAFPGYTFSTRACPEGGYLLGLEKDGRIVRRVIPSLNVPVHLEWTLSALRRDLQEDALTTPPTLETLNRSCQPHPLLDASAA